MKIWVLIMLFILFIVGLIVSGIFLYKYVNKAPLGNQSAEAGIGIFDISQNCTMQDANQVKDCCQNICMKYCSYNGKKYTNHYLNNNNEIVSCYCWC